MSQFVVSNRYKPNYFVYLVKMRANDDGAGHKAVLLSGPPGIGKTTTAQIVCKVRLYDDRLLLNHRM